MRRLDHRRIYPAASLMGQAGWAEALGPGELTDVLRSTMRDEYAGASDQEMSDALEDVLESMSPAEAFNFGSALSQIGKSAGRLVSDPTFIQIARTAAPIAGGALGTLIGGPVGTALGSQLGNLAANALTARAAPPPAAAVAAVAAPAPSAGAVTPPAFPPPGAAPPVAAAPVPGVPATPPGTIPPTPSPASSVAGGSAAAAQGLVLTQQPDVLRSLLATALGQHGRQRVSGVPAAQVLGLLSQVFGQAAADADALMYLDQQADAAESVLNDAPAGSVRSLYTDLLGADNLEFAEAAEWAGLDR